MSETYKLIYFGIKGRGEAARIMFSVAGQQFEDSRIDFADWGALKPSKVDQYDSRHH